MTILNLIESSQIIDVIPQGLYIDSKEETKLSLSSPVKVTQNTLDTLYPESNLNIIYKIEKPREPVLQTDQYLYAKDLFFSLIEKENKCFSKFSSRDEECKNCIVAQNCAETKGFLSVKRKKKRTKKEALEAKAQKLGFSFKGFRVPKKAIFTSYDSYICQYPISCVVSLKNISIGDEMCHVKHFGIVHTEVINLLIEWKAI